MIFAVSLYSCIRWVTDYTKEGHYWTQSLGSDYYIVHMESITGKYTGYCQRSIHTQYNQ